MKAELLTDEELLWLAPIGFGEVWLLIITRIKTTNEQFYLDTVIMFLMVRNEEFTTFNEPCR